MLELDEGRLSRPVLRGRGSRNASLLPDYSSSLDTVVRRASWPMVTVNTDEWCGYNGLPEMGRSRAAVCHVAGEWARDDDGDGIREVHVNTLAGLWTGLRNFPRPFRGVNKMYLYQYVELFKWGYNVKRVTDRFVWGGWG